MMFKHSSNKTLILATALTCLSLTACLQETSEETPPPNNVILFIGDGMDEHQITMARNYLHGAEGAFAMEKMPVRSSVTVQTVREDNPDQFRYVADSANTASTLATGQLTSIGRISTSAAQDSDLETVLEAAQKQGYSTGLVSTASITDATPAAFATHISKRGCQGPKQMSKPYSFLGKHTACDADRKKNGGPGSIAAQLAASGVDVLLGGGMAYFGQPVEQHTNDSPTILDTAINHGYKLVTNAAELQTVGSATKLLGLFGESTLPTEWACEGGRKAELISFDDSGNPVFPEPLRPVRNPKHQNIPTLEQMTRQALNTLSQKNSKGFFLMVEGASIDKQSHDRNPCGQIGELDAFDRAVAAGREFASRHPNTLIIVTADHGQAGQVVPLPETYQAIGASSNGAQYSKGYYAILKTLSGELMAVNYATNSSPHSEIEMHTGTNVPAYMEGPGTASVPILIDQRYINRLMRKHLRIEN